MSQKIIERPILFSGPMVQAILDGRKTQTRRVIRPQPTPGVDWFEQGIRCPYGKIGDWLYVKETFAVSGAHDHCSAKGLHIHNVCYRAGGGFGFENGSERGKWRPSRFMPRWASRITLEITEVRVQRVQDIGETDCVQEGVEYSICEGTTMPARVAFRILWETINGKREGIKFSWANNPWIWAITFKRV